jgi:hypothetical protein
VPPVWRRLGEHLRQRARLPSSQAAVKDFARFLIEAEAEAERKALEAEIADEERIREAGGGSTVDPGAAS